MNNRIGLVAVVAAAIGFPATVAHAQPFEYGFTVDVTSGPLVGDRYMGITFVDGENILEDVRRVHSVAIEFEFGGIEFTETQDVQDVDAQSPRANFEAGQFLGTTYIVSRFGRNPTDIPLINGVEVDGFAIDNSQFGYVVGPDLYGGTVNYLLSSPAPVPIFPETPNSQQVPEPSLWLGVAAIGCGCWRTRRPA